MLEIVLLCAGCHGMNGEGRPEAGYPRIAGQPQAYLARQLEAYADGRRASFIMEPLARSLSAEERRKLAAEFSSRSALGAPPAKTYSARGEALAVEGDDKLRVQACQNCHGPLGRGQAPYGASLAGLQADYLRAEMNAWRSGRRSTDPSGQMPLIARLLGDEDVEAVAAYYAGLPVPPSPQPVPLPRYEAAQPPTLAGAGTAEGKASDAGGSGATGPGAQGPGGPARPQKK